MTRMKLIMIIIDYITKKQQHVNLLNKRTPDDNNTLDTEVVVPLKYFSKFWRFIDLILVNCELTVILINLVCHGEKNVQYQKYQ